MNNSYCWVINTNTSLKGSYWHLLTSFFITSIFISYRKIFKNSLYCWNCKYISKWRCLFRSIGLYCMSKSIHTSSCCNWFWCSYCKFWVYNSYIRKNTAFQKHFNIIFSISNYSKFSGFWTSTGCSWYTNYRRILTRKNLTIIIWNLTFFNCHS